MFLILTANNTFKVKYQYVFAKPSQSLPPLTAVRGAVVVVPRLLGRPAGLRLRRGVALRRLLITLLRLVLESSK